MLQTGCKIEVKVCVLSKTLEIGPRGPIGYETDLAARKGTEGAEMCVVKTTTKPGNRLICFCHSSVQKKSALILSYNNNITKVLHTFLWSGGMFTK